MNEDYYVKGLFVENCNVTIEWNYAEVVSRDPETKDPLSIAAIDGTELVFLEGWEFNEEDGETDVYYEDQYDYSDS